MIRSPKTPPALFPHSSVLAGVFTGALAGLLTVACGAPPGGIEDPEPGPEENDDDDDEAPLTLSDLPPLAGTCVLPATSGGRLAVTTTDFASGALSIIDTAGITSEVDVALATTDSKPFAYGGYLYLLHRFQADALDVLDPAADWALSSQQSLAVDDLPSVNPQMIAFSGDQRAYIPLFGSPELRVFDLADPRQPRADGAIDLQAVADDDGNPEASLAVVCGDTLLVHLSRLDADGGFVPREEHAALAVIDRASRRLYDLAEDTPGIQGITLRGQWARQWRLDPRDPSGGALMILSEGIERLDLTTLTSDWVIPPEVLADLGIVTSFQPQAFALSPAGDALYLASYTADFAEVVVDRFLLTGPDGSPEGTSERVLEGVQTSEQALEIVGDTLWIGDRTPGSSGIRGYLLGDAAEDPLTPLDDAPLATGLPPYAMIVLP